MGVKDQQGFNHADCLFFLRDGEGPCDRLLHYVGADQKIPNWLIKITFLVKAETAVELGIKSRFGIISFSTSNAILGLWFFSLTTVLTKIRV